MKRAIVNEATQLQQKLQGHVHMMFYGFQNLCVRAEEAALLPISVNIDGQRMNIEDVANIARKDEYSLMLFPKYDDEMVCLAEGVAETHPEFKQNQETLDVDADDGSGVHHVNYLLITMPEVDDNRYDLLKKCVKGLYEECKVQMEAAKTYASAKIAALAVDESPENKDLVKKTLEEVDKMWKEKRDEIYDNKLKEIEDGHQRYLQSQNQQAEDSDAGLVTSMQLKS